MQKGHWREVDFPKTDWRVITHLDDPGPDRKLWQQCGMCKTAVCRWLHHVEHAGPPYRCLQVGADCAVMLTGGDLRTPSERAADAWEQERERIISDPVEFQRALDTPWSWEVFANFGWYPTPGKGNPRRPLADGSVTLFANGNRWKVSIYLDGRKPIYQARGRPCDFSFQSFDTVEKAREHAWRHLVRFREQLTS
jgi:hypothetical protein